LEIVLQEFLKLLPNELNNTPMVRYQDLKVWKDIQVEGFRNRTILET
jgi:hypothetical protein